MVTSVAYPIGAHWCWATEGWLHKNGFRDFAGAGVVHLSGGIIALVGEYIYRYNYSTSFSDEMLIKLPNHSKLFQEQSYWDQELIDSKTKIVHSFRAILFHTVL